MPAANLIIVDDAGATIPEGTAQIVTGQIPGTPTPAVTYGVKNDGATNDTATNVKLVVEGRLVSAGGDYLARGVGFVDEAAMEVRRMDAASGGNALSGWRPAGYQRAVPFPDIAADETIWFEARVSGNTDTSQVELLIKVLVDSRSRPVGDHVGTGSGVYFGAGDGETTDVFSRSGSAAAVSTPSHIVELDDQAWLYLGEPYQILAADLHTTPEDGSDVAISPADATKGYYIGLTLGHVVVLSDTWTVSAGSPNVTAANTLGDATTKLTVGDYVQLGGEIHEVLTITDDDNFVLHTNHAAGATAQPVFKGWHVAKGDQVLLSARTDADKPTLPTGEVYSEGHVAGQIYIWREGDDTIEGGDIDDQGTVGFYSRSASGLDVTIARGRSKVHGYEPDTSTSSTITLPTNQTNTIQINGPDDAAIESTTDGSLNPGGMALYEDVTDGAGVTGSTDQRRYLREEAASAVITDMSAVGDKLAVANPSSAPRYILPGSVRWEIPEDPSSLGWASGSWVLDLLVLNDGTQTSIFRTQGTNDQRPTIPEAASTGIAPAVKHELIRVEGGESVIVRLDAIPVTPGTDPVFGIVSWIWFLAS